MFVFQVNMQQQVLEVPEGHTLAELALSTFMVFSNGG